MIWLRGCSNSAVIECKTTICSGRDQALSLVGSNTPNTTRQTHTPPQPSRYCDEQIDFSSRRQSRLSTKNSWLTQVEGPSKIRQASDFRLGIMQRNTSILLPAFLVFALAVTANGAVELDAEVVSDNLAAPSDASGEVSPPTRSAQRFTIVNRNPAPAVQNQAPPNTPTMVIPSQRVPRERVDWMTLFLLTGSGPFSNSNSPSTEEAPTPPVAPAALEERLVAESLATPEPSAMAVWSLLLGCVVGLHLVRCISSDTRLPLRR